jgi:hypothetical protein
MNYTKTSASQDVSCREAHLVAVVSETSLYITDLVKVERWSSPSVRCLFGARKNIVSYLSATTSPIYERHAPTKYGSS